MEQPLKVGLIVDVILTVREREIPCEAEVVEINENTFVISSPKRKGVPIPVESERITVQINRADAVITMTCQVEVLEPNRVTLSIPPPEAVRRVQRRKFLRVRTKFNCLIEAEGKEGDWDQGSEGTILDISGGGCAIAVPNNFLRNQLIRITMELPDEGKLQVMGRVIRAVITKTSQGPSFQISVEFQFISEVARAKVIRYVFSVQRQMAWRATSDRRTGNLNDPLGS